MVADIFAVTTLAKASGLTPVFGAIAAVLLVVGFIAVAISRDPKSKE